MRIRRCVLHCIAVRCACSANVVTSLPCCPTVFAGCPAVAREAAFHRFDRLGEQLGDIVVALVARVAYAVGGSTTLAGFAMISVMGIQVLASIDLHARANQNGVPAALRFFNPLLLAYLAMPIDGTRTAH